MDPRYRFTMVIGTLLVVWWVWEVVSTFLFGAKGLNLERYQLGVIAIGAAVGSGFALVWLAATLIRWRRLRKTGFEASPTDEFGTAYEMFAADGSSTPFKIALSKFQPALVAPPPAASLHPLEAELIGFLNGYRSWPLTPENPDTTLYEMAMARWQVMRQFPQATPWHGVLALAKDLAAIHALDEIRESAPWYELNRADRIRYRRRSQPLPGMAALILSTMPAFRALSQHPEGLDAQRAMLTALRYHATPQAMPLNAGPLATTLVEALARAEAQLGLLDPSALDELTPARQEALATQLPAAWLALLGEMTPAPTLQAETVLYRASAPDQPGGSTIWLHVGGILGNLGQRLDAELRTTLQLWDVPTQPLRQHPGWSMLYPLLLEQKLIDDDAYGLPADAGTFLLLGPDRTAWGPCVKLLINPSTHAALLQNWQNQPMGPPAELALDPALLHPRAEAKLAMLEARLREAF